MASMDQRIIETEGPGVALALHVAEVSLTKGIEGNAWYLFNSEGDG